MSGLRLKIIYAAILLAVPAAIFAGGLDYTFDQANQYYIDGDYDKAAAEYEKILKAGYHSAELYYNLGNAYFREGQLGQAIANYLRARRLAPRDDDIRANLQFARQYTIDKIEITGETILLEYVNRFFDSFSVNEIIVVAAFLYLLAAALILVRFIYRWYHVPTPICITVLVLFIVGGIFAAAKIDRDVLTRKGVVLANQIEVRSGPGEDFNSKFTAHAGLTFNIDREEAGYYWVNFENRLKGWLRKQATAEI